MDINIGDTVRFLNQVGGGKVTGFERGYIMVEDEDGFAFPVREVDLVVVKEKTTYAQSPSRPKEEKPLAARPNGRGEAASQAKVAGASAFSSAVMNSREEALEERIRLLENQVQKLSRRIDQLEAASQLRSYAHSAQPSAQQGQNQPLKKGEIVEIDLHAEALLSSTQGLSASEIKEYQMKVFRQTMQTYAKDRGRRIVFIHGNGDGVLRKAILDELKYSFKNCRHQDASFLEYGFGATMVTIG